MTKTATTTTTTTLYYQDDAISSTSVSESSFRNSSASYNNNAITINSLLNNAAAAAVVPLPKSDIGSLGDIMSPTIEDAEILFRDGLVTKESQSLCKTYGITHPLDRIAITANGNLQRLFSSYYDTPVHVHVEYCQKRKPQQQQQLRIFGQDPQDMNGQSSISVTDTSTTTTNTSNSTTTATTSGGGAAAAIWDRRVLLQMMFDTNQTTFCTATSMVMVHNPQVEELIEMGVVGIGQLFRHYNVLPQFTLLAAGPQPSLVVSNSSSSSGNGGGFWRNYTLTSPNLVTCYIHEVFCEDVWNLKPHHPDENK